MPISKPNVALVDDEPELLTLCQELLSPMFEVSLFETANHFLTDIQRGYRPDVVVTDLKMPGKSGLELAQSLLDFGVECGVLMMSGFAERSDLVKAMSANVSGFIDKPFDPMELIEKVKTSAQRRRGHLAAEGFLKELSMLHAENVQLNSAYFHRLADIEDTLFENFPEIFSDRKFQENYVAFLKSTGAMTRKISSGEGKLANALKLLQDGGRFFQGYLEEEGASNSLEIKKA